MRPILAVDGLTRVRGGSQAHVIRAEDSNLYVCKFLGNPQSDLVLCSELIATRLAQHIGLPVPDYAVILAPQSFFESNPSIRFDLGHRRYMPTPGLQFGSKLIEAHTKHDYVPASFPLNRIKNLSAFAGVLAFDKWTCQADGRQALFFQSTPRAAWQVAFIDHGYALNIDWNLSDAPLRGTYASNYVYEPISRWNDFEPWISRIENISEAALNEIASDVPEEWLGGHTREALYGVCSQLYTRRLQVRDRITDFRRSSRQPFPNWISPFASSDSERPNPRTLTAA